MKILYLMNFAGKGGTEKYVYNLMHDYHGKTTECFLAYNIEGLLCERAKELSVPVVRIKMRSPFDIFAAIRVAFYCKKNKIDIIHTQFPRENYVAILSKIFNPNIKVFNTNHIIIHTGKIWNITNRIFTRFNEKIIAVCNYGKEVLISNGVPKDKIEVIFNGVPSTNGDTISTIRNDLGISKDTFVISTLTRYTSEKGVPLLVDIAKELSKITDRDFVFLVAGDGDMFEEIKHKINDEALYNKVVQLGYRNDAPNILAGSDLFINTSESEALSFAIIEALGYGLPIVATNVGGTGDIVNNKTDCGLLFEYGDAKGGAKAIKSIMDDTTLKQIYSTGASRSAKEYFDIEKLQSKLINMYKNSLK